MFRKDEKHPRNKPFKQYFPPCFSCFNGVSRSQHSNNDETFQQTQKYPWAGEVIDKLKRKEDFQSLALWKYSISQSQSSSTQAEKIPVGHPTENSSQQIILDPYSQSISHCQSVEQAPDAIDVQPITQIISSKTSTSHSSQAITSKSTSKHIPLDPLTTPWALLEDMSALLGKNDEVHVLTALVLLRRGILHHKAMFVHCLHELVETVATCLQSRNEKVIHAALLAAYDLTHFYGDNLLQYMYFCAGDTNIGKESLLFRLIYIASAPSSSSSSLKYNKHHRQLAEVILQNIANTFHQASIMHFLEHILANIYVNSRMKSKITSLLLLATYRLT